MRRRGDGGRRGAERDPDAIVGVFDVVTARFLTRLEGLDDAELLWEPAAGCWTVRQDASGAWVVDGDPEGLLDVAPVTTIAWRLTHLACHVLGGFATWLRDGGMPFDGDPDVPHTAAGALAAVERNWPRWREGMARLDAAAWTRPIGEEFGEHATASTADLVLHVLDELVHHAAEVSLLRDLYAARPLPLDGTAPTRYAVGPGGGCRLRAMGSGAVIWLAISVGVVVIFVLTFLQRRRGTRRR